VIHNTLVKCIATVGKLKPCTIKGLRGIRNPVFWNENWKHGKAVAF